MEGSGKEREVCNGSSFPWLTRTHNRFWKLSDCFSSLQQTPSTQHQVSLLEGTDPTSRIAEGSRSSSVCDA